MNRVGLFFLVCIGTLLVISCQQSEPAVRPANVASNTIPVAPEFQSAYMTLGGQGVLGAPITGVCHTAEGQQVQYFQRVRLDYASSADEVALHQLGSWALEGVGEQQAMEMPNSTRQRLFSETGITVQDEFLNFYEANNGELLLGAPISPQIDEGELRVQYFQNGRLEWHPEAPRDLRVQLGLLGEAHYAQTSAGLICDSLAAPEIVPAPGRVAISASVKEAILYSEMEQMVYVSVVDPAGNLATNQTINLTLTYNGQTTTTTLGQTDADGKLETPIELTNFTPGEKATLQLTVLNAQGQEIGTTTLSFRTWW